MCRQLGTVPVGRLSALSRPPRNVIMSTTRWLCGPVFAQPFCLLQDCLGCFLLFVWWVTVLAEDALDHCAEFGANALLCGPVNGHIPPNGFYKFASYCLQGLVTED